MKLSAELRLPFPREIVYAAYRDDIASVLEFLPNVRTVELKSRNADESTVRLIHEWYGGGEVPAAVRGIIGQSMLGWTSYATWDLRSFSCDWRIEAHKFPEGIQCRGRNSFDEDAGETLFAMRGTVEVDGRRLPGVPSYLARSVARSVEEFLVATVESNVRYATQWFEKYRAQLGGTEQPRV